jgi:hypothetical protein
VPATYITLDSAMINCLIRDPRKLAVLAAAWAVAVVLILATSWPAIPRTSVDWLLLVFVGVPLYIAGEIGFAWLFSPKHGAALSERKFSWLRIWVALGAALAAAVLYWAVLVGVLS